MGSPKCLYDKKILGKLHKFQKEYKTTIVLHVVKNEAKFVDVSKFVCLVECIVPLENFHSYGDVTIAGEGLQILTNARHSWQLSSEGSLTCHTYCDTGLPFVMVISEDPWHSNLLPSVWQWSCHYLFLRLRSVATGDRTLTSRTRGESSTSTPPRRLKHVIWSRHSRRCVAWS